MKRAGAIAVVATAAIAAAAIAAPHRARRRPLALTPLAGSGSNGSALSWTPIEVDLAQGVNDGSASAGVFLTNIGSGDVHIGSAFVTGGPAWAFGGLTYGCAGVPCTLPMGGMALATVVFDPSAVQLYTGSLIIVSDTPQVTVALSGSGTGAVLDADDALDIGSTPVHSTVTSSFSIRNTGNASQNSLALSFASPSPQFALGAAPTIIPPSSSVPVSVSCTPDAIDTFHATLNIDAPGAVSGAHLTIDLSCSGIDGNLQVTPSPVDFGEVRIGVGSAATVTLAEVGSGAPLTLDEAPMFDSPAPSTIALGPPSSMTIAPGAPAHFDVTVTADPGATGGDVSGHITLRTHGGTGSGGGSGAANEVGLDVKAKLVTATFAVPASIEAGTYCIGEQPRGAPVSLSANGTGAIVVQSVAMERGESSAFGVVPTLPVDFPSEVRPPDSATVQLVPKSQTVPGVQTDNIVWTTDAAPGTAVGKTMVSATFVTDGGAISPQHIDFGTVALGVLSANRDITLENCGTEPLVLQPLSIDPAGAFSDRSEFPLPTALASSETATISVAFQPKKAGGATAVLTVASSKGPLSVMLVGAGLGDGSDEPDKVSFYDCGCRSTPLSGAAPFALALLFMRRRRR